MPTQANLPLKENMRSGTSAPDTAPPGSGPVEGMPVKWLKNLLGRKEDGEITPEAEGTNCAHLVLLPTWSNPEDMGREEKATGFRCYACGVPLTIDEAQDLRSRSAISL